MLLVTCSTLAKSASMQLRQGYAHLLASLRSFKTGWAVQGGKTVMESKANQLGHIIPGTPVTINFGLPGHVDWYRRANFIRAAMRDVMVPGFEASIHVPSVTGEEGTVVIRGQFSSDAVRVDSLWGMLVYLKEDCCAIYYTASEEGHLFGPNPGPWEPFDASKFKF